MNSPEMEKTPKAYPIGSIAGICTGIVLDEEYGYSGNDGCIRDVMDHLCPGIMSIMCAMMMPNAASEIYRQHPKLEKFLNDRPLEKGEDDKYNLESLTELLAELKAEFGETLDIVGPMNVSQVEVERAMARFGKDE
jgi:hypothetical protein